MTAKLIWRPWLTLTVLAFWACASWAESRPAFWRVKSSDSTVYLLGSMHFGHPDFFPLPAMIEQAFNESSVLAVEVDIARIDPSRAMQALTKFGQLPPGQNLGSVIAPDLHGRLTKVAKAKGIPITAFDRFQPWFVAMQLVEDELRTSDLKQELGIDLHFLKAVKHQQVHELESLEGQLRMLAEAPLADQEAFLKQTLDDLERSREYLHTMADVWRRGDEAALQKLLVDPFRSQVEAKRLYQRIFRDRNLLMTEAVEAYLKSGKTVFFVVGAGHMVSDDGIVELLRNRKHRVERLR